MFENYNSLLVIREKREAEKQATMERLHKMAFTVNNRNDNKPNEEDDDDDEFMKEYRKKRLEELKQAQRYDCM